MMAIWLLTIGVVIFGVAGFIRRGTSSERGRGDSSDQALDTLRERYARGEIGNEEFDRMSRKLSDSLA